MTETKKIDVVLSILHVASINPLFFHQLKIYRMTTKTEIATKSEILNKNGCAQTLNNENVCEYMQVSRGASSLLNSHLKRVIN